MFSSSFLMLLLTVRNIPKNRIYFRTRCADSFPVPARVKLIWLVCVLLFCYFCYGIIRETEKNVGNGRFMDQNTRLVWMWLFWILRIVSLVSGRVDVLWRMDYRSAIVWNHYLLVSIGNILSCIDIVKPVNALHSVMRMLMNWIILLENRFWRCYQLWEFWFVILSEVANYGAEMSFAISLLSITLESFWTDFSI